MWMISFVGHFQGRSSDGTGRLENLPHEERARFRAMTEPMWKPSAERIAKANMTAFLRKVRERGQREIADYPSLYRWSIEEPAAFWQAVWEFCGIIASRPADQVVVDFDKMPGTRWFPGARLNFAENLLRFRDDRRALVFWDESGFQRAQSYAELYGNVARLADALRGLGVKSGDRVAAFVPNIPETVVSMLAVASLGAIWSSCSPDFGPQGVLDRFGQIEPKVLFAADGYRYDGREFDSLERLKAVQRDLPTVERVVVIPCLNQQPNLGGIERAILWPDLLSASRATEVAFEQLPFDHPLYILYSSGTTGPPKCIVHSAGGVLLQHQKEHVLHCDLRLDDVELAGEWPGGWLPGAPLRRFSPVAECRHPVRHGRARAGDGLRDQPSLPVGDCQRGARAARHARSGRAADDPLDRLPPERRKLRLCVFEDQAGCVPVEHFRRDRSVFVLRAGEPDRAGLSRRAADARAGDEGLRLR